jgi:hypothetical protein
MLCSRSLSLMTSTRGSRAIATTILRMVSASAALPSSTLSSFVTPSTRCATSSPKVAAQPLQRVVGVLDGVVQQRRDERRRVHAQLGQDRRHGQRVGDVRIARLALLARVPGVGDVVGALQQRQVRLRVQDAVHRGERFQDRLDRARALRGHPPGEAGAHALGGRGLGRSGGRRGG